jgi:hypothetical protein
VAVQQSIAIRNAKLEAAESIIGPSPILRLRTGAQPASCAAARTGTVLAVIQLPADWLSAAVGGVKTKLGLWQVLAIANGNIGHYEIVDSTGVTCHEQGNVTVVGGGGNLTVDTVATITNQLITVIDYSWTEGNA